MSRTATAIATAFGLCSGGCAIQPIPQDVTGLDTYAIVAQFRCEMKDVLSFRVKKSLRDRDDTKDLADELDAGALTFAELMPRIKNPGVKAVFDQYAGATILYDFSLNMTEQNNFGGGATLLRPFTRGSDTIGFNVSSDHKRQNTRTFTITDTFEKLLMLTPEKYCATTTKEPNYNYPIAGRTRLDDTVLTFLDLNQSGNLGTKPGGPKTPTIADDIQFTTKYSSAVSPGFTFTPLGRIFQWSGANGKFEASREDLHRVTVVLSLPLIGSKPTALTIAETRANAQLALANSDRNRTDIAIQSISGNLNNISSFGSIFP